jgi:hypothetical protein
VPHRTRADAFSESVLQDDAMVWWCWVLVVGGLAVAARGMWTARQARSTGAHGMVIAVGLALAFWGLVLGLLVAWRTS